MISLKDVIEKNIDISEFQKLEHFARKESEILRINSEIFLKDTEFYFIFYIFLVSKVDNFLSLEILFQKVEIFEMWKFYESQKSNIFQF